MKDRANAAWYMGILWGAAEMLAAGAATVSPTRTAEMLQEIVRWIAEQYDLTGTLARYLEDDGTGR